VLKITTIHSQKQSGFLAHLVLATNFKVTTQKPKWCLQKTAIIHKTKPNETKAWFRNLLCHLSSKRINVIGLFNSSWGLH